MCGSWFVGREGQAACPGCSPTRAPGQCLHFECRARGAPARVRVRGDARGSPPLAPPLCVCVEKFTLPYLTSMRSFFSFTRETTVKPAAPISHATHTDLRSRAGSRSSDVAGRWRSVYTRCSTRDIPGAVCEPFCEMVSPMFQSSLLEHTVALTHTSCWVWDYISLLGSVRMAHKFCFFRSQTIRVASSRKRPLDSLLPAHRVGVRKGV